MKQTKSYPRPSKIRYRLERVWLRLWLRKLILYLSLILVFSTFCLLIFVYSNDWIKLKDYKNYLKLREWYQDVFTYNLSGARKGTEIQRLVSTAPSPPLLQGPRVLDRRYQKLRAYTNMKVIGRKLYDIYRMFLITLLECSIIIVLIVSDFSIF